MSLGDLAKLAAVKIKGAEPCPHSREIRDVTPDSTEGCPECIAAGDGWVHLRICMSCGHVGCCDSSKNRHASKHAASCGHPILRSFEGEQTWMWCTACERYVAP